MWLGFPSSLSMVKAMTDTELRNSIVKNFWLQFILLWVLFIPLTTIFGYWVGFCAATMNPFSRYPIFFMGMCAGELSLRHSELVSLEWPWGLCSMFPTFFGCCFSTSLILKDSTLTETQYWSKRVTVVTIQLMVLTVLVSAVDSFVALGLGVSGGILGVVWLQSLLPFLHLELIVALTRDGAESFVSQVFRSPTAMWLGERSMCLYLVHWPLIFYLCWIMHGSALEWPQHLDCSRVKNTESDACEDTLDDFNEARLMPVWGVPLVVFVSLILAEILFVCVDEPCRKFFRSNVVRHDHVPQVEVCVVDGDSEQVTRMVLSKNQAGEEEELEGIVFVNAAAIPCDCQMGGRDKEWEVLSSTRR
jgi:peptidoglycan/LPS O-acetylase OafA/YrhL